MEKIRGFLEDSGIVGSKNEWQTWSKFQTKAISKITLIIVFIHTWRMKVPLVTTQHQSLLHRDLLNKSMTLIGQVITTKVVHNRGTVAECVCVFGICMSALVCRQVKMFIHVQTLKVAKGQKNMDCAAGSFTSPLWFCCCHCRED